MKIPTADEVLNHPKGYREGLQFFHRVIGAMARRNHQILVALTENRHVEELGHVDEWTKEYILDYPTWGQIRKETKRSVASYLFCELLRLRFISQFSKIQEETRSLEGKMQSDIDKERYSIMWSTKFTEFFAAHEPDTPVMSYTQSQVMNALLYMTKELNNIPHTAYDELKRFTEILYTRCGVFFCDTCSDKVLDVENMRLPSNPSIPSGGATGGNTGAKDYRPNYDFLMFCTIYFYAIMRRLFYYTLVPKNLPPFVFITAQQIQNCKDWVEQELCRQMSSEIFEKTYNKAVEVSYQFSGDIEWFKYRNPDQQVLTGPILDCFRTEQSKQYYLQYRISMETALSQINLHSHLGHTARLFVFIVIDQYFQNQYDMSWKDLVVVDISNFTSKQDVIMRDYVPYLAQLFSRHACYVKGQLYASDNFYENLTMWFYFLKIHYESKLFSTSIEPLVNRILIGKNEQRRDFSGEF